jgi:N-methylhydantoinase A/oxoprolinase/acetone carboxylase beta subunit
MDTVSENGILSKQAFDSYKQRSVRSRFLHQIFLGIGGATIFGVAGTLSKVLLESALALTGPAAVFAGLGLATLAVAGLSCLYIGAKYLSQTILLDQDFQAKKIGLAARGVEPVVTTPGLGASRTANEEKEPGKRPEDYTVIAPVSLDKAPGTRISEAELQQRVVPISAAKEEKPVSFADRVAASEATVTDKARA